MGGILCEAGVMKKEKFAVCFYGYPGSGKGTQADLVAKKFGATHFNTGVMLQTLWYDPTRQDDPTVISEKALFEAGKLNTPSFVLGEVAEATRQIAAAGGSVVFSGSPRTIFEAEGLVPTLEELYGREHMFFFFMEGDKDEPLKRNGIRKLCKECETPVLMRFYAAADGTLYEPFFCPLCGGSLYRRTLDDPTTIPKRVAEYEERTFPILDYLKKNGHTVHNIDGRGAPYVAFRAIAKIVGGE